MDDVKKVITAEIALARLEDLCARAEHSAGEIREKLRRWGIAASDGDKIIESLKSRRFVDDSRFAEAYVADKVKFARWGKRKIYQGLLQKRVDSAIIKEMLEGIDPDLYVDNLRFILQSKIRSTPDLIETYEGRTKLYRMAIQRGYDPSLAGQIIRSLLCR